MRFGVRRRPRSGRRRGPPEPAGTTVVPAHADRGEAFPPPGAADPLRRARRPDDAWRLPGRGPLLAVLPRPLHAPADRCDLVVRPRPDPGVPGPVSDPLLRE